MRDLAFFIGGFTCCLWLVFAVLKLQLRHERRDDRRPGYVDFTISSANTERRDASANQDKSVGLSGGGDVTPPPHLRLVRDGGSTEVFIPFAGQEGSE